MIWPVVGSETESSNADSFSESVIPADRPTGTETPEGNIASFKDGSIDNPEVSLTSDFPVPKRYAHHGKRRRSYTEEMFRCQFVDMISRTPLICNHLLWKNRPSDLRNHLIEHINLAIVEKLSDDQVLENYKQAKKIYLEGIPEDIDDSDPEGDPEDDD